MLNVKSYKFNPFKQKKKKEKRQEFWRRLQKKSSSARFLLQPSVAFWLNFNQNLVIYRMKVISER